MYSLITFFLIISIGATTALRVHDPRSYHTSVVDPANRNSPQAFLDAHNRARAEVGVQPLKWNATVANYALRYAQSHYEDCQMEHSRGPYGENLAEGLGRLSAVDAVGMWVSEKNIYDYNSNSCVLGEECRHYTQVVWRDSTHLGCARLRCRNGWLFVICNYDPPGNYIGQLPY